MQNVEAGSLGSFFSSLMNSAFKSFEGLFSDKATNEEKATKGSYVQRTQSPPANPVLDENGNPFGLNACPFEVVWTLRYRMNDIVLTKKTAKGLALNPETWSKATDIDLSMAFGGEDKVSKQNLSPQQVEKEMADYKEKHDVMNKATSTIFSRVFLYNEGSRDVIPQEPSNNSGGNNGGNNGGNGGGEGGNGGGNGGDSANASTSLKVTLRKVTGKTDTKIRLTKINANYDILDAMNDLDNIVSDDNFVDQLPENEDISYEITSDESDYDVNPCEDFSCQDSIQQMIFETMRVSIIMRVFSMAIVKDPNRECTYRFNEIVYNLDNIASVLSDSLKDCGCSYIPGFEFMTDETECRYNLNSDCSDIADIIDTYLQALNVVYDCLSTGAQYKLGEYISYLEESVRILKANE